MKHRYDPGAFSVQLFTAQGRKRNGHWLARNWQEGKDIADRWARRTGGSGVVLRCVYNSLQRTARWD